LVVSFFSGMMRESTDLLAGFLLVTVGYPCQAIRAGPSGSKSLALDLLPESPTPAKLSIDSARVALLYAGASR
jgi:hypothetical protein